MNHVKIAAHLRTFPTARKLGTSLGCKVLKQDTTFNVTNRSIINWGRSDLSTIPGILGTRTILNHPEAVARAVNKLTTLATIGNTFGVEFTTDADEAAEWLNEDEVVFARTTLSGYGGRGIVVARTSDDLVPAPLYTKYFNGRYEFRVHVAGDVTDASTYDTLLIQRKGLPTGATSASDGLIRNLDNGYTFVITNPIPDDISGAMIERMAAVCKLAVHRLGLHFGAVDVRMKRNGEFRILEVNSAPGLSGTTLEAYTNYFRTMLPH